MPTIIDDIILHLNKKEPKMLNRCLDGIEISGQVPEHEALNKLYDELAQHVDVTSNTGCPEYTEAGKKIFDQWYHNLVRETYSLFFEAGDAQEPSIKGELAKNEKFKYLLNEETNSKPVAFLNAYINEVVFSPFSKALTDSKALTERDKINQVLCFNNTMNDCSIKKKSDLDSILSLTPAGNHKDSRSHVLDEDANAGESLVVANAGESLGSKKKSDSEISPTILSRLKDWFAKVRDFIGDFFTDIFKRQGMSAADKGSSSPSLALIRGKPEPATALCTQKKCASRSRFLTRNSRNPADTSGVLRGNTQQLVNSQKPVNDSKNPGMEFLEDLTGIRPK